MAVTLKFLPGSTIRWRDRQYLIVDYVGLDAVLAREPGKVKLTRIPVREAQPNHAPRAAWIAPDLVSVSENEWREAVKRFQALKPLLSMEGAQRTLADVEKTARILGRHPVTVYRWIENYKRTGRLSVFLRKQRSDQGASRLSNKVDKIIDSAIKQIYLKAESPHMTAIFSSFSSVLPLRYSKRSSISPILNGSRPRRGSSFDWNISGTNFANSNVRFAFNSVQRTLVCT